jgi:hypothetical protein
VVVMLVVWPPLPRRARQGTMTGEPSAPVPSASPAALPAQLGQQQL